MKEKSENSEFKAKPTDEKSTKPEGKNDETQNNLTEKIEVKLEVQQNNSKKKSKHLKHLQHLNSLKGNKSRTKPEMKIPLNQKGEMT